MRKPYRNILTVSVLITVFLFLYDTLNKNNHGLTAWQRVQEIAIYGLVYIVSIFCVASVLYFCTGKLIQLIRKIAEKR
jgi:fumarate reductase subunit D